jgi:hypothetical protein
LLLQKDFYFSRREVWLTFFTQISEIVYRHDITGAMKCLLLPRAHQKEMQVNGFALLQEVYRN